MTYLEQKKKDFEKLTGYLLNVATINHVERLAEVKKAVTMVTNAYDYVVETERKMKK